MSLENPFTFLLAKEKTWKHIFHTNSELLENQTEKQIMPYKTTTNWQFNDLWCYVFNACFDWKIGIIHETVVKGFYYILDLHSHSWKYHNCLTSFSYMLGFFHSIFKAASKNSASKFLGSILFLLFGSDHLQISVSPFQGWRVSCSYNQYLN